MNTLLTGRDSEKAVLTDVFHSNKAEFAVLYGRRRIGKTFLVEQFFKNKTGYFFQATGIRKGTRKEQLKVFAQSIGSAFYQGAHIAPYASWLETFEGLTRAIENTKDKKKVVLFFDELPWMCTPRSRLLEALDYYWNRHWKNNKRIKLIVCGSSASWMIRKILHHKGGLHNRHTCTLLLQPFNLRETEAYFKSVGIKLTQDQLLQITTYCGGVPYYLSYIKKGRSIAKMIDQMCFEPRGVLYDEFDKLFDSLFDKAKVYKELIRIIAQKREGISRTDIEKQSALVSKGGTLTTQLKNLEDAAFIQSFLPLQHKRQGVYYRVIDEYCYFYLKWIEPTKRTLTLKENHSEYWRSKVNTPTYNTWMGYMFENLCYKHIKAIRKTLDISAGAMVGVWRHVPRKHSPEKGVQIDLLFERDDNVTTLCEIKYSKKQFVIDKAYAENLERKINIYKKQSRTCNAIHFVLIAANGVKKNNYYDALVDDVVTLADFF